MTGIITDIHRTSVVDGPGLRTTVFLKGCPLRCLWCHNPETQSHRIELGFNVDKCTGCGDCVAQCPESALALSEGKAQLDRARCTGCGKCVPGCPSGALFLYGKEVTVREVMSEILKDRAYYAASGGGVTISGGEPMAQPEFALALLRECRNAGIHTALDTSGFLPLLLCEKTMGFTSLYLLDYKATDEQLHLRLTGVPQRAMLATLDFLMLHGAAVILRCPIIPGMNDDFGHLSGIAAMDKRYPMLEGIEILPWHTMGNSKYGRLGRTIAPGLPTENTSAKFKTRCTEFIASLGGGKVRFV